MSATVYNYKPTNFIAMPRGTDAALRIYDKNNKHKYSIVPTDCYFYYKDRYVYIRQDGDNNISLDFETEKDAATALLMLNDAKSRFFKNIDENREYYTKSELDNGVLDDRYYTTGQTDEKYVDRTGDVMTGELTFSAMAGDYIVSINVDELGTLIKGNQSLINRSGITASQFVDIFEKTMDFSVFWEYAVKDISSGINIRAGSIVAAWDEDSGNIAYSHTSTMDIGNTTGIDFVVNMDGGNTYVRLFANVTSGDWRIKVLRRFV